MANFLNLNLGASYEAKKLLVVYQYQPSRLDPFASRGKAPEYYLESHHVEAGEGNFHIGPGEPLSQEVVSDLAASLKTTHTDNYTCQNLLPRQLIGIFPRGQHQVLLWYKAPGSSKLHFTDDLGIPDGKADLPGLLFAGARGNLSVFAYQGEVPEPDTPLFHAPFHNVSDQGAVCLGNAKENINSRGEYREAIAAYEKLFFGSQFSHLHGSFVPTQSNLNSLLKGLILSGAAFPVVELKPHAHFKTLSDLLKRLS